MSRRSPIGPSLSMALLLAASSVTAQTWLIDFGNDMSFRGLDAVSPDVNGNHWTSVWSGAFYENIVDSTGAASSVDFGFDGSLVTGTDSFNGPAGVTASGTLELDVLFTDIDSNALGDLGGSLEAAFDYYVSSRFQIQQLDPTRTYDLTFFGSHKFNNDDNTRYNVYSDPDFTNLIGTADLLIGSGPDHNRDTTVTISGLTPTSENDILFVEFVGATGGNGYLNAMQIVAGPSLSQEGDFNGDGMVDNGDLNLLLGNWGADTVPGEWTNGFESPVDNGELNALLGNWGAGVAVATPEPHSLMLATLLLSVSPMRRRSGFLA